MYDLAGAGPVEADLVSTDTGVRGQGSRRRQLNIRSSRNQDVRVLGGSSSRGPQDGG